jgi:hypothetical protein
LLPICLLWGGLHSLAAQKPWRILSVEPTALFPNQQPLRQIAILHVENPMTATVQADVQYLIAGQQLTQAAEFAQGETDLKILVPDIASSSELEIVIRNKQGTVLATHKQPWLPQRKWKVYIIKSSHEDLGYEGTIYQKQHDNANWIDIGKMISDPIFPMGHERYHYNIETMVGARDYITERGETAWRNLVETELKTGNMSLLGAPSGVHSHWMDYEELARITYPAKREMKDRYGLDFDTFMIVDNPSLSWSGMQALAGAGFKYVARWGQGWRTGGNNDYAHTGLPAIFWWVAPDGQHRMLYSWRSHYEMPLWYGQGATTEQQVTDVAALEVSRSLKSIESGEQLGPYPYDAVVYPQYYDHEVPHTDHGLLAEWSKHFAYPVLQMTSPTSYFEYMDKTYGSQIPTRTGDLNNFSADYATIDPESQGWKRAAARTLPFAEGMHAIAGYLDPRIEPITAEVSRDYTLLFDYDEHSWPTLPDATDLHVFNGNYVKKETARRVEADSNALLNASLKAVGSHIGNATSQRSVAVWNSLAHDRNDPVTLDGSWKTLADAATGERVPTQTGADGKTIFLAKGVPAYGYKVYRESDTVAEATHAPAAAEDMENEFFHINADSVSGNIVGIYDKRLRRDLVDPASKYQFNQFIAIHKNERESLEGTEETAGRAQSVRVVAGPLFQEMTTTIEDEKSGAEIVQVVRLYSGIARIDIQNTVRHARVMSNPESSERYKDNFFYAFPFAVPGGQPRAEYPGGVVRPFYDQLRWGSHDYLSANRWVDVSSKEFGVTIAPWNEQIFEFGSIRYNQFSIDYKPAGSAVFGYVWSNRMTGLLDLDNKHPEFTVGYSITSHAGDWDTGTASRLGWTVASPLVPSVLPSGTQGVLHANSQSFLSVAAPNVELTVLKESEQPGRGWIVRLVETAGKATDADLSSPLLPVAKAFQCTVAEDDESPLQVAANNVRVHLLPFGTVTVRLLAGSPPGEVSGVTAHAISGEKVELQWTATPGVAYNVYRSEDPDDPASAYTLIGRTTSGNFADDGLMPSGTYIYRVGAVNATNLQGPVSPPVTILTMATNEEPPPPVTGLTVVALTGGRHMVAWDKSPAGDIREFELYRWDGGKWERIATQKPSGYSIETYIEDNPASGQRYFVVPVDWAGNRQTLPN